jgi:hypothetical protein
MTIRRALQPEQWQVLQRLRSVGCPVDDENLPTPLDVFVDVAATQFFPLSQETALSHGTGIALPVRVVASTSITICRFRLQLDWVRDEISWLGFCDQHPGDPQKHYCFPKRSWNDRYSSDEVLNHRTLHRGVLKRCGFLSGLLLGTFRGPLPPTHIGTKLQATLSIEDLSEHEYRFPIVLFDTTEDDWEDWMLLRASAREGRVMPLTGNEDEPM